MKKWIWILLLSMGSWQWTAAQGIGTWNAYLAYSDITGVEQAGNQLFVLASNDLFVYNTGDQSVQTFDKVNALSDSYIQKISYNPASKRLVILYSNNNIDLMDLNHNVTNVSDYYSATTTNDKTVNDIYMNGAYAYLSNGFGIIKLDTKDAEISDTYNLGFKVNYCYIEGNKIYAASASNGLYSALLTANLLDKGNWTRVGNYTDRTKTPDADLLALARKANPGGPKYNYFFGMQFHNGQLYTNGGGYTNGTWLERPGTIQVLNGDKWTIYEDDIASKVSYSANYHDIVSLAFDPSDATHIYASSTHTGVYEFNDGKYSKNWTFDNSPQISVLKNNYYYVLATGITTDDDNSLWVLNSWSKNVLLEKTKDNQWVNHTTTELAALSSDWANLRNPFYDKARNKIWFCNDSYLRSALISYDKTTGATKVYDSFINEDGTDVGVSGGVKCVCLDNDQNIWIGTSDGPLMLTTDQISSGGTMFTQVKVPRNDGTNYADYLLANIDITGMAIDGGGRKWFSTASNGVYLISEDNLKEIHHFTTANSKLLSDNVESVAINSTTGEVYFGTQYGLCSYMGDATAISDKMTKDNVYAYPNPVRPDYTGLITVVGLTYNADVKIVTSNGVLVNEGKSNGGTYTWDGCDKKGKQVASGIYMVETATSTGDKGTVCKIAIVR